MKQGEIERLLDLLAQASEELDLDGAFRDNIGELRNELWDILESRE
jgi:hypothetical protein